MANQPKEPGSGLLLRLLGVGLIAISVLACTKLWQLVHCSPRHSGALVELFLAYITVATACPGSVLALLGRHLFDEIELPNRAPRRDKWNWAED